MKSRVIRFCALGILLCLVGVATSPKAIACLNNSRETTYYAWAPTEDPDPGLYDVCCGGGCIVGPQQEYDRRAVGGRTVDCDGTVTTWGFNPMCGDNETVTTACPACGG